MGQVLGSTGCGAETPGWGLAPISHQVHFRKSTDLESLFPASKTRMSVSPLTGGHGGSPRKTLCCCCLGVPTVMETVHADVSTRFGPPLLPGCWVPEQDSGSRPLVPTTARGTSTAYGPSAVLTDPSAAGLPPHGP